MDKNSKIVSICLIVIIVGVIVIATSLKVYDNHKNDLLKVVNQKIEEAAKKCSLEEICTENKTTLAFLIEKGYLEKQVHPISKEFIGGDLEIVCENYACKTNVE